MNAKVAVLLVLYNDEKNLNRLYNSLRNQTYKVFRIYVLDSNSSDNSVSLTKKLYPEATIIESKQNVGFAKGNNILASRAFADCAQYLYILNCDMELHPECIDELVKLAKSDKNIGVVSPIIFFGSKDKRKNKIQDYAEIVNFKTYKILSPQSQRYFESEKLPEVLKVNIVEGGAMFIKSKVYEKVGLFEERYFMYGDEIDLAHRVYLAGYKMFVSSKAKVWHYHDWSKKNKKRHYLMYYYILRNRYLYFRKFRLYKYLVIDMLREVLFLPIKVRWALRFADVKLIKFYYQGIWDGLLNKNGKANVEFK